MLFDFASSSYWSMRSLSWSVSSFAASVFSRAWSANSLAFFAASSAAWLAFLIAETIAVIAVTAREIHPRTFVALNAEDAACLACSAFVAILVAAAKDLFAVVHSPIVNTTALIPLTIAGKTETIPLTFFQRSMIIWLFAALWMAVIKTRTAAVMAGIQTSAPSAQPEIAVKALARPVNTVTNPLTKSLSRIVIENFSQAAVSPLIFASMLSM